MLSTATAPGSRAAATRLAGRPSSAKWSRPSREHPAAWPGSKLPGASSGPSHEGSRGTAGLAGVGVLAFAAARQQRRSATSTCIPRRGSAKYGEVTETVEPLTQSPEDFREEEAAESAVRVAQSLELLNEFSEAAHPGHQPGRFADVGPEFEGMEYDGLQWRMLPQADESEASNSQALMTLNEQDLALATQYEAEGGVGLLLTRAFTLPDRLRAEARKMLRTLSGEPDEGDDVRDDSLFGAPGVPWGELKEAFGENVGPLEQAAILLQAADIAEEREAIMRNTWSDIEFDGGEASNAELVARLEQQFATQLVRTAEVRLRAQEESKANRARREERSGKPPSSEPAAAEPAKASEPPPRSPDGIFDVVLKGCADAADLARRLPQNELTKTLSEPRNIGVALDLVGAYLKNYNIDKADRVLERVVPLCRQKGGTWLIKALDKLCAVRMKQFRAYEALVALKEIESLVPFKPEEGWEFHDIMFRNFAWCYSSLDEAEKCLEYTRKSVEVKKANGVPASWFDIWDLGKAHARLGQKKQQRDEMRIGYDLCRKAGEIHRKAEASDRIMLAKILSNVGEVAMGIGDSHHLAGEPDEARLWYEQAEEPLRESYELHATALGPMKPLSGWQAGTMAHCMVRLERWEEARDYLALSLKVECSKDSTTPGSLIELLDRVMNAHQELGDLQGMFVYVEDLLQGVEGLKMRGWDRKERDVFALLQQRVATAFLVADDGTGRTIPLALNVLREAETNLVIFLGDNAFPEDDDEEAFKVLPTDREVSEEEKMKYRKFGPQVDNAGNLLKQIRTSIRILGMSQASLADVSEGGGAPSLSEEGSSLLEPPRFEEEAAEGSFEAAEEVTEAEPQQEVHQPPPLPQSLSSPSFPDSNAGAPGRGPWARDGLAGLRHVLGEASR